MALSAGYEAFSVSHAAILGPDGLTDETDILGVRSGSLDVDTDSYDNTGDDTIMSRWAWFNTATLTIDSGYVSFQVISLLTGSPIVSSGTTPDESFSIDLWAQESLNQPVRPVLVRCPSKDRDGNPRFLDYILYRVQFAPITFAGPTYKDGLVISYSGQALMSEVDETGTPLARKAMGRIVSHV